MIILCVNFYDFGVESFCRIWCTVVVLYPYYGIINKNTQVQGQNTHLLLFYGQKLNQHSLHAHLALRRSYRPAFFAHSHCAAIMHLAPLNLLHLFAAQEISVRSTRARMRS